MSEHDPKQIKDAAQDLETFLDKADPNTIDTQSTEDLRAVAKAADRVQADEARLRAAVDKARAHGWSEKRIAMALGESRVQVLPSGGQKTQQTQPRGKDEQGEPAKPVEIPVPKREDVERLLRKAAARQKST